jgi:Ca2+-binding EF-hand superfamily protein
MTKNEVKSQAMQQVEKKRLGDAPTSDDVADAEVSDEKIEALAEVDVKEYAEALEQVSSKLDKKQFSMLLAIFKLLDKDKNGTIDPEEFRTGIAMLNRRLPAASRIDDPDKLFRVLDADGSGSIDLVEFQQLHISM